VCLNQLLDNTPDTCSSDQTLSQTDSDPSDSNCENTQSVATEWHLTKIALQKAAVTGGHI